MAVVSYSISHFANCFRSGRRSCRRYRRPRLGRADDGRKGGGVVSAVVAPAVDEEGRGAGDTAKVGTVDILGDAVRPLMLAQLAGEALHIEAELLRVSDEIGWLECVLVVEQQVVHLPERTLFGGCLGCLGSELGLGMDIAQRQVAPDVEDVAELAQEFSDERLGLSAVGAFEVTVLDDCDG